jgi:hypothetical protein
MSQIQASNKFTTDGINVTATASGDDAQLLYECPANFSAIVKFLHISSNGSANKKISIQYYNNKKVQYDYLLNAYVMDANSSYDIIQGAVLYIHAGDKLVCYTDTAGNFDVLVSAEEYFNPGFK